MISRSSGKDFFFVLFLLIPVICLPQICLGCGGYSDLPADHSLPPDNSGDDSDEDSDWTILVYLNGDSDLESQALRDFNEMEASVSLSGMRIIVLFDRSPGYDTSQGDWSGTRLYRVRKDRAGLNCDFVSERLACPPLGLGDHGDYGELNLGAPEVLSAFIGFGKSEFPSGKTMLIIWGHGTGWRGKSGPGFPGAPGMLQAEGQTVTVVPGARAFSFDDSDCDFLYTSEFGEALENESVDMVVFDTCFSALIEVVWELRTGAGFLAGSQGLVPVQGLDYGDFFSRLSTGCADCREAGSVLLDSFALSYEEKSGSVFSVIDVGKAGVLMDALNGFVNRREEEALLSGEPEVYYQNLKVKLTEDVEDFFVVPGDLSIDLGDLGRIVEGDGSILTEAVEDAVLFLFKSEQENTNACGLSVHLCPLGNYGEILPVDRAYCRTGGADYMPDFVSRSLWCPDPDNQSGFLYNLFPEK